MHKTIEWYYLIGIGLLAYAINYVVGGVIGSAFALLGIISLALGVVRLGSQYFGTKK